MKQLLQTTCNFRSNPEPNTRKKENDTHACKENPDDDSKKFVFVRNSSK